MLTVLKQLYDYFIFKCKFLGPVYFIFIIWKIFAYLHKYIMIVSFIFTSVHFSSLLGGNLFTYIGMYLHKSETIVSLISLHYCIVASRSTCYYSGNQKFCFLKARLLTCRNLFLGTTLFCF